MTVDVTSPLGASDPVMRYEFNGHTFSALMLDAANPSGATTRLPPIENPTLLDFIEKAPVYADAGSEEAHGRVSGNRYLLVAEVVNGEAADIYFARIVPR